MQDFVVPIVAATLAATFALLPPVKVALVAMSVSPVPPILPGKQLKFGGRQSYVYGLLVAVSIAAIIFVPLSIELLGKLFDRDIHMGFVEMAKLMGRTILVPLGVGIAVREFAPGFADRFGPWVLQFGNLLLIIGLLPVLIASGQAMWSLIGNGTILAILAIVAVAMVAGHRIGGPDEHDRTALGLCRRCATPASLWPSATRTFRITSWFLQQSFCSP